VQVEVPKTSELGTLGAVICAAVGAGYYSNVDEAVARMVKITRVINPDRNRKDIYDQKYTRYLDAINALDTYWNK
jgi:L-xylulokinase